MNSEDVSPSPKPATVYTHLALTLNPSPVGEGRKTLTASIDSGEDLAAEL